MKNMKKALGVAMVIGAMAYCMVPNAFVDRKVSKEIVDGNTDDSELLTDNAEDIDEAEVLTKNLNKLKADRDQLIRRLSIPQPNLETYQLLSIRLNHLNQAIQRTEIRLSDV